ncbi:19888_t:CDS:2 [Gigaspora rosea]|nr:19888_t:CDS:2 [Gigaspora rosea]
MARQHTSGLEKHRFTKDIVILGTKATNKHNTYGICKACDDALGRDEALKDTITNKKNTDLNHLKRCEYFRAKLGSQEAVNVHCNKTDNEEERTPPVSKRHDNTSDVTTGNSTSSLAKTVGSKKKSTNSIDNFIVRNITAKEKPKFEQLLLRMTVSNGWSFR